MSNSGGMPFDIQISNEEWDEILRSTDEILDPFREDDLAVEVELKCECGAEAVYGPNCGHSSYCPKHED